MALNGNRAFAHTVKNSPRIAVTRSGVDSDLYPDIAWNIDVPTSSIFNIDENLLRQVFLNLIKNAIEAGVKNIAINYNGSLIISNDGHIIPDESRKEIFIPFFTTKSTGSGIGLSLSRQMMVRQGGDLCLAQRSVPGYQVTFIISCVG
jgi:signal transduction histidine kinase